MARRSTLAIVAFAVVILCAALMRFPYFSIAGIAPNLLLAALVVFCFFTDNPLFYIALVLVGVWFGRATPQVLDPFAVVTTLICLIVFWLRQRMISPGLLSVALTISAATVLIYGFIDPAFLWQHPGVWLLEVVYNVVLGLVLFEGIQLLFNGKTRSTI